MGIYLDAGSIRGYLRDKNGDYTRIDVPGATLSFPYGINNRGDVVGFFLDSDLVRHSFVYKDGAITTTDHPLAASDSESHDLNDRGQIVGLYERAASDGRVGASAAIGASGSIPTMSQVWPPR